MLPLPESGKQDGNYNALAKRFAESANTPLISRGVQTDRQLVARQESQQPQDGAKTYEELQIYNEDLLECINVLRKRNDELKKLASSSSEYKEKIMRQEETILDLKETIADLETKKCCDEKTICELKKTIADLEHDLQSRSKLLAPPSVRSFLTKVAERVLTMYIIYDKYGKVVEEKNIGPILRVKSMKEGNCTWEKKEGTVAELGKMFEGMEWGILFELNDRVKQCLHDPELHRDSEGAPVVYVWGDFCLKKYQKMSKDNQQNETKTLVTSILNKIDTSTTYKDAVKFV